MLKINIKEKKQLIENITYLGILQVVNYVLPLLTLPYLARVLGPDYFGILAFATATIAYFGLITDYGFNLSATRQISVNRDNIAKVTEIYSSVITVKFVLMMACFLLMVLLVFSFEKLERYWEVYFLTFGTIVGQTLFPIWLFQGMERMKHITYLNILAKVFFTVCIFIFVREEKDYLLVPLFTGLGFIISGVASIYLIKKEFNIIFVRQSVIKLKLQLFEGWHVFYSSMAIGIYTVTSTIILGLFATNAVVGYFSAADKLVQAVKGIYFPVSQAIYPLVARKIQYDKNVGLKFIRQVTLIVGTSMFLFSIILCTFADRIVFLVLGEQYQQSVLLLQIMAFLPFVIALSNIYGIQTMLNLGYKEAFSRILTTAALLGIILSFIFVPLYGGYGTAITLLAVEFFVTATMWFYLKWKLKDE